MSWTKRQFILQAFAEAGLASYAYDLTPDQLQSALYKLDSMMGTWTGQGIATGYPVVATPTDSDLDTLTTVPTTANQAIYSNLAIRIAPDFGKTLSNDTQKTARQSYLALLSQYMTATAKVLPTTLPKGSGTKYWRFGSSPYIDPVS